MVTLDDFDKIWASTSPLTPYEFSDPNYSQGWNFIGSTPPARQMWDSIQKKNDEKFKYLRDNFGTPNIVTSSSQMTDTEKVYVYMGSEAGWNSGHWYYWDGSAWADGGVYNSVAFVTDTTLSIAGQPADAKAVGDALTLKADLAGCTFTGNVNVNADFSVTGDSTLTGNVSASGDVNATGDVTADNISATTNGTIGGALSVAGASTLTGNVSAGADITVVGDVSSANIIASNNANIGGNATVTGSVASASLTTTADGTIGGNLSVSGTTALAGTSTAPTPSADDNSTNIATTEYVQTEIKPIETDVTINDKRITNIEKLLQGNLYDYQTDSSSAYTKTVPAGAMPYAGLEKVGGKTVVWNQYTYELDSTHWANSSDTYATVTFSDGVATVNVVGDPEGAYYRLRIGMKNAYAYDIFANHKYYYSVDVMPDTVVNFVTRSVNVTTHTIGTANVWTHISAIETASSDDYRSFQTHPAAYISGMQYKVKNPMLIDLTLMFGSGNEPSTVAEFESMFPADYYAYNAGTLLSAGVTSIFSEGQNLINPANFNPIPASIQALDGYGWSCPDHYNYIDFEAKKYVQEVGSRAYASGDESDSTVITDGTTTYYPLNPAIETDISEYITDDNLIQVEAGGTLTFPNSNGDDYQIPVPSEEEYMIDLQSAIGG